jgi:hypothetical protein
MLPAVAVNTALPLTSELEKPDEKPVSVNCTNKDLPGIDKERHHQHQPQNANCSSLLLL